LLDLSSKMQYRQEKSKKIETSYHVISHSTSSNQSTFLSGLLYVEERSQKKWMFFRHVWRRVSPSQFLLVAPSLLLLFKSTFVLAENQHLRR
jgi:hypothetical protein